jgi:hypothetical protein
LAGYDALLENLGMDERYIPQMLTNSISDAEKVRLVKVIEEAGELAQAASKCLLWGYESRNPMLPNSQMNISAFTSEYADLCVAVQNLKFK